MLLATFLKQLIQNEVFKKIFINFAPVIEHTDTNTYNMRLFKILFLFICVSGMAQTKVGTIDVDYIISKLPELTSIQTQMVSYGKELDNELQTKLTNYDTQVAAYKSGEAGFTEAQKQEKQTAILGLEEDISKFQTNGNQLVQLKRDELLRPAYTRIGASLEKIAKSQGYTQVLQTNNTLVFVDPAYDLTRLVLTDLGIKLEE